MLFSFFLLEAFNEDVTEVVPVTAYPTTLRRWLVDVAAKIVFHGGKTALKVTAEAMESLRFKELLKRFRRASCFVWA